MESPQLLGTDVERCRECRGHVVQAGEEFVCTSCGVVARKEEPAEVAEAKETVASRRLGSYMGSRKDRESNADFNGNSTVGFAKRLSDNIGQDQAAGKCVATIRRVADKLSLPPFVMGNAVAESERILAECRAHEGPGSRRKSVPAISAYAVLSACRTAGMDHIGSRTILRVLNDMGHVVSRSALLNLGLDSKVPFRPADPKALLTTAMAGLESSEAVLKRLRKDGFEPGPYFRSLLQVSMAVLASMDGIRDGRNPRTVAAGSVYIASRKLPPRALTQKEVAEVTGVDEYTVREFCAWARMELGPLNPGPS